MNLIFTQEAMNTYNDVLHFNLKHKKARYVSIIIAYTKRISLQNLMRKDIPHDLSLLVFEMNHFIINVQKYSIDGVLTGLWNELIRKLATIQDIDELRSIHEVFMDKIQKQCLFHNPQNNFVKSRIMEVLQICWKLTPETDVDEVQGTFRGIVQILLSMLHSRLNQGIQMHLEGLALRWDFNYFYSESALLKN